MVDQHSEEEEEESWAGWKREDARGSGSARNRRSGPHVPGEDGAAVRSMAPPCGRTAHRPSGSILLIYLLCETRIQMCTGGGGVLIGWIRVGFKSGNTLRKKGKSSALNLSFNLLSRNKANVENIDV